MRFEKAGFSYLKIFLSSYMRKIFFVVFCFIAIHTVAFSQTGNDAAINNILLNMPAQNKEQLNKSMEAVTALGETGIAAMAVMFKDAGDNTALEFALGGYAYYVMQPGKQAQRTIAVKAYCAALDKVAGVTHKQFIIKQLQQMGNDGAVATLQTYLQDKGLSGDAARALQQINTPAAKAALKGDEKHTRVTIFNPPGAAGAQNRIAQLYDKVKAQGAAGLPLLQTALKDDNMQYRQAALWYAKKFQSPANNKQWLALLPSLNADAQVQVIDFVAAAKDETTLPSFTALLKHKNKEVRIAAIAAAGKVGNQSALPALLPLMKTGDDDEVTAVKNAILVMKGDGVMEGVVNAYASVPSKAKVALLDIMVAREYDKAVNVVVAELQSTDTAVHDAAARTLPAVVLEKNVPALFTLLNNAQPGDVPYIQQAIISASVNNTDTAQRLSMVTSAIKSAGEDKAYLYLNIISAIGGNDALAIIQTALENGSIQTRQAAVEALGNSKEAKAARMLLQTARNDNRFKKTGIDCYIKVIKQSSFPADQKLIMLKEAMPLVSSEEQRTDIIKEAGNCNTFLALIFAGQYLDDAALQQEAAHAVMDIALAHSEFNGEIVKNLLAKAGPILNDKDADYERQAIKKHLDNMPVGEGFVSMFNGHDLTGWKGLVENPVARAKMPADTLAAKQGEADNIMRSGWTVKDGQLIFTGKGENLCTVKQYADVDMYVDWKITPEGDAGIYLRGSPQVQIWDTSRRSVGAQVGSGGLYNNQKYQSKPLVLADNAIGEWNSFHIIMRDDKVTVYLNGVLVTDNITLENYWDRSIPIFPKEQIELQAHGTYVAYRDLYIKELTPADPIPLSIQERKEGFTPLFDGSNLDQWTGDKSGYKIDKDGSILVDTTARNPGNMYTKDEYGNFVLRFQFQLTPGANNGIGIRAPLEGDAAYVGMEIQVLDSEDPMYKDLHPYQYHGSVYGVIPAKRGFLKPLGQWNEEEIIANGPNIKVTLNGEVILNGNIDEASKSGTADQRDHPGLKRQYGHIGFLGHGSVVRFKNVRVKTL
jgi:HEAT repeat protein